MTARDGSTRRRPAAGARTPSARRPPARGAADARGGGARPGPPPGDGLVVGPVPPLARAAGVLLVLAGVVGLVAPFPTYLVVGGQELVRGDGVAGVLAAWVVPAVSAAVGAGLAAGRVPRFGLAFAGVLGAPALGLLVIELYRARDSTVRPAVEVLAGERVLTSSVEVGAGWVLGAVSLGLLVLAGVVAAAAWGRTVMEDGGALDPLRPVLAGAGAVLGVATVLCLVLPAADVPDRIVTDPVTGLQTVVGQPGPQGLLERPGLALLGGLLLAAALVLGAVVAPSLRPRLAAVGGLLAITVVVLAAGLGGLRDAGSPDLRWTVAGAGLLVAGLAWAGLTAVAWRARRAPAADPGGR